MRAFHLVLTVEFKTGNKFSFAGQFQEFQLPVPKEAQSISTFSLSIS